jgi:cytidylate kinase
MSNKPIIVAIDGFSSSGKSTMAKNLAKVLGYRYIDSGAMYRAVTLYALDHGMIDGNGKVDEAQLVSQLGNINIDFAVQADGTQHTTLNGVDVESEIRGMRVSESVSPVAAIPAVRHDLVAKQQAFGESKGIVMDGRDIGTTVFPNAELKIFVNASAETRAQRRFKELMDKGVDVNYEEILANVVHRDSIDTTRAESPLRQAEDAICLDNSNMTLDEQNAWIEEQVRRVSAN